MSDDASPTPSTELADHRESERAAKAGDRLSYPFDRPPEPGQTRPVADGIWWLRMPLPFRLDHINLYLLADGDGWAVVDTGLNTSKTRALWEGVFDGPMAGRPVTRVIVTHMHPDHIGLAGWLAERFSVPLYMTRAEFLTAKTLLLDARDEPPGEALAFYARAGFSDQALDAMRERGYGNYARAVAKLPVGYRRLEDGDELVIGGRRWRILTSGGHAPEHACLSAADDPILISGDQVLPRITSNVGVYPTEPYADPMDQWLTGLARLKALVPADSLVLPSHNRPFKGLDRRLDDLIEGHLDRLVALTDLCREPVSALEAFPALYRREITGMELVMAIGESLAHLHYLERRGVVDRVAQNGVDRFVTVGDFDPDGVRRELSADGESSAAGSDAHGRS